MKRFSASGKRSVRKPWRRARLSLALPFLLVGLAAVSAVKTACGVLAEPASVAQVEGSSADASGQPAPVESEGSSQPSCEGLSVVELEKPRVSKSDASKGAGEPPIAANDFGVAGSEVEAEGAEPNKRWWRVLALALPAFRWLDDAPAPVPPLRSDLPVLLHRPAAVIPSAPRAPPRGA